MLIWVQNACEHMSCERQYERTTQSGRCETSENLIVSVNCRPSYSKTAAPCLPGAVDPLVANRSH